MPSYRNYDKEQEILNYVPPKGKCLIYRYSSNVGDYIGQTKYSMKKRAGKDGAGYLNSKYRDTKWAAAIKTYGINFFIPEILEECLETDVDEREKFYIEKYNTHHAGFNSTPGGKRFNCNIGGLHPKCGELKFLEEYNVSEELFDEILSAGYTVKVITNAEEFKTYKFGYAEKPTIVYDGFKTAIMLECVLNEHCPLNIELTHWRQCIVHKDCV